MLAQLMHDTGVVVALDRTHAKARASGGCRPDPGRCSCLSRVSCCPLRRWRLCVRWLPTWDSRASPRA